jgi:hypothetical protein
VRGQVRRREAPDLQPAGGSDEEERQVGRDVPEVRNAEQRAAVAKPVVGGILGDRVDQEDPADRGRSDEDEQQDPVRRLQDFPTTS